MCIRDRKKTKKIRKICRRKINTREELEMMKNGLIKVFNLPITDHEAVSYTHLDVYKRQAK